MDNNKTGAAVVDFNKEIRDRPIGKKIGVVLAVGCCACALGYNVLINSTLQLCVEEWGMSLTAVQQISNLPSLLALVGSLIAAGIIGIFGRRTVATISFIIITVTGIAPAIITSMGYTEILVARAIGGFFTGLVLPIGTSLAADYFEGTQKRFMMGFNMAFSSILCGVILNMVAGYLCAINWRMTYWVLAVFVIFIFISAFCIPKTSKEQLALMRQSGQGGKFTDVFMQNGKVWKYCIFMFILLIPGHIHSISAATAVTQLGGEPTVIGLSFSVMTAGGAVGSLCYAFFCKPMKKFAVPIMLVVYAIGLIIAGTASTIPVFLVGIFLGAGVGWCAMVGLTNSMVGTNAKVGATVGALALANIMYNLGQYITPILLNPIAAALFGHDEAGNPLGQGVYLAGCLVIAVLFIWSLISALKTKQGEGDHLLDW